MKKIDIVNLIKSHVSNDEESFKHASYEIADEFAKEGDAELAKTIYGFLSEAYSFEPQMNPNYKSIGFLNWKAVNKTDLYLPDSILQDLVGVMNAVNRKMNINKFLFYGEPGTGKTEAAKLLANKLKRELWMVSIRDLIDSKLGATSKNIYSLFNDINQMGNKNKVLILFDEIDSLALNRIDERDLREMGRATTELFSGLDNLDPSIVLVATTNLFNSFDKALLRRFNKHINFNRYSNSDLIQLGTIFYNDIMEKISAETKDEKLVKKILTIYEPLPYPGELKNIITSSVAFSDPENKNDYLSRLVTSLSHLENPLNMDYLQSQGFSLREIAKILNQSKSRIGRRLNYGKK